jgi:uncharacterized membrane protein YkgB
VNIKGNWKKLSLIGLISVINGLKYLVKDNNVWVFLASSIMTVVIAVISFLLTYYFVNVKTKEERIRIGLKVAAFVVAFNTASSYIF